MRELLVMAALCGACAPAEGEVEVRIYGEEFIEAGIPASVFADGWSVQFDSFLISVGAVTVGEGLAAPGFQVFDLTRPSMAGGQRVAGGTVQEGAQEVGFVVGPDDAALASEVSAEDLARMKDGGLALYVAGSATRAGVTKRFAWGFPTRTRYSECEAVAEVEADATAVVELTIHGDHLFYDDLYAMEPAVRFDLVAQADADDDGEVTQAELLAVDLRPLPNYQVGSTGIVDLWHFIAHQTTTLGHIDGEGHCDNTAEE